MKRIEATFRPAAFGAVKSALQTLGIEVINLSRSEDMRRRRTDIEFPRGDERRDTSVSMVSIEVVVADAMTALARDIIVDATLKASPGAGKILISSVDEAIDLSAVARSTNNALPIREPSRRELNCEALTGEESSRMAPMNGEQQ